MVGEMPSDSEILRDFLQKQLLIRVSKNNSKGVIPVPLRSLGDAVIEWRL